MAQVEIVIPRMGEGVIEATVLNWLKQPGDWIEEDEIILEIATDKVDTEVPATVAGKLVRILAQINEVVPVGQAVALLETDAVVVKGEPEPDVQQSLTPEVPRFSTAQPTTVSPANREPANREPVDREPANRLYSPLVRNIAKKEGIAQAELEQIPGTGQNGRVTKVDMLRYVEGRSGKTEESSQRSETHTPKPPTSNGADPSVEVVEMSRMRQLIADHMVMSKQTSPHVSTFLEVDVTDMVKWRDRYKADFQQRYGQKLTFTPLFVEAVVKAIRDFPNINVSVAEGKILIKKRINIGMATALPSGNLIVPVLKDADQKNLAGLARMVNDLADRARNNQLKPEEIQDGTFTITNIGTFGNDAGTPIINQPQVAILAFGAIRKKPAVVETEIGDVIAIRHRMILSISFDHRVVDGYLGGSFLRKVGDYLEQFDAQTPI